MAQQPVETDYKSKAQQQAQQQLLRHEPGTLPTCTLSPPVSVLKDLLRLTEQGKLSKVRQELTALEHTDACYQTFTVPLLELASQLQTDTIKQYLCDHLSTRPMEHLLVEA